MEVRYGSRFNRDLARTRNRDVLRRVERIIAELKAASDVREIRNVRRVAGQGRRYRIRLGDYRLGFEIAEGAATLLRIGHRREFYRDFP